jgi:hypothetical protein
MPDTNAQAGLQYRYVIAALDSDVIFGRDSLTYKFLDGPRWLSLRNDTLSGTPFNVNAGDSLFSIAVVDKKGKSFQQNWKINVVPIYLPPTAFRLINASTTPLSSPTSQPLNSIRGDTIWVTTEGQLTFLWKSAHGHDPGDTISYELRFWGSGIDTSIRGVKDTIYNSVVLWKELLANKKYTWTVSAMTNTGKTTSSKDTMSFLALATWQSGQVPKDFIVYQNYPNPFNPSTTLRFGVPKESKVKIAIYNMLGQQVAQLVDGIFPAQYYTVVWNGARYSSGVYFAVVRMESTDPEHRSAYSVKKLVMIK